MQTLKNIVLNVDKEMDKRLITNPTVTNINWYCLSREQFDNTYQNT